MAKEEPESHPGWSGPHCPRCCVTLLPSLFVHLGVGSRRVCWRWSAVGCLCSCFLSFLSRLGGGRTCMATSGRTDGTEVGTAGGGSLLTIGGTAIMTLWKWPAAFWLGWSWSLPGRSRGRTDHSSKPTAHFSPSESRALAVDSDFLFRGFVNSVQ